MTSKTHRKLKRKKKLQKLQVAKKIATNGVLSLDISHIEFVVEKLGDEWNNTIDIKKYYLMVLTNPNYLKLGVVKKGVIVSFFIVQITDEKSGVFVDSWSYKRANRLGLYKLAMDCFNSTSLAKPFKLWFMGGSYGSMFVNQALGDVELREDYFMIKDD